MRVLQVTSEAFPLCKTGGLADVTSGLSAALVGRGDDVRLMMPAYPGSAAAAAAEPALDLGDPLGVGPTRLLAGRMPETDVFVWLVDCPAMYQRRGGPYLDPLGQDWPDNHLRFGLLGRVAALVSIGGPLAGWTPDVVHAHDWQAGLVPAHLALWGRRRPATVFTVHNLHFHGSFPEKVRAAVGLPVECWSMFGVEFHGALSFLKAGLYYANQLTTVSPTYAREIQTPVGGEGFEGLLASRAADLHGILNGIDTTVWDPRHDRHLPVRYDAETLEGKTADKRSLQEELGLAVSPQRPLFGLVGRLTHQKGIDLLLGALETILSRDAQLCVLGSGEGAYEQVLAEAARRNPRMIAYRRGYDEALSHRIIAGSDALLVPSRFEPCGLTQLYALRYGTIPVVRRTGGLADTVPDIGNDGVGVTFFEPSTRDLVTALDRALELFADPERLRAVQRRGMELDHGWAMSADAYRAIYRAAIAASEADGSPERTHEAPKRRAP